MKVVWTVQIVWAEIIIGIIHRETQVWCALTQTKDGQVTGRHAVRITAFHPRAQLQSVNVLSKDFDDRYYYKSGTVTIYFPNLGYSVTYNFEISAPPFNDITVPGEVVWQEVDEVEVVEVVSAPPPIPPPPVVIPPPVGPPIEVVLEPPGERPRPVVLPPPVEPPPVDWRPGPLPPDITPPPRTRETDIFTLRAFAAKWGDQIDRYALNVPLDGGEVVAELEEPYRSFWQRLTMHKADIVFERKGVIYVAEIKPRLSRGAIGEAITAHELFKLLHKPKTETRAAVIVLTAHPTLVQTASWLDVLVFVCEQVDTGQPAGLYSPVGRRRP